MRYDRIFKVAISTAVLGLVAALGTSLASADYVNYSTTITGADLTTAGGTTSVTTKSGTDSTSFGVADATIRLINYTTETNTNAGATYDYAGGPGTFIPIGTISVNQTSSTPLVDISKLAFSFKVNLNDFLNPQLGSPTGSGVVTVSGFLSGSIGTSQQQGKQVNLSLSEYSTDLKDNLITIGGTTYEVLAEKAANYFNAPTSAGAGTFQIHLQAVPEPGSLVMLGLGGGLGVLGLVRRRRNRAA